MNLRCLVAPILLPMQDFKVSRTRKPIFTSIAHSRDDERCLW